jgi:hypothetical protein
MSNWMSTPEAFKTLDSTLKTLWGTQKPMPLPCIYTRGSTIFRGFGWKVVGWGLLVNLTLGAFNTPTES